MNTKLIAAATALVAASVAHSQTDANQTMGSSWPPELSAAFFEADNGMFSLRSTSEIEEAWEGLSMADRTLIRGDCAGLRSDTEAGTAPTGPVPDTVQTPPGDPVPAPDTAAPDAAAAPDPTRSTAGVDMTQSVTAEDWEELCDMIADVEGINGGSHDQ